MQDAMLGLVFWEGHVVDSSQERADGSLLLSLSEDPSYRPRCGHCGNDCVLIHERRRRVRDRDGFDRRVWLDVPVRRLDCYQCSARAAERLSWLNTDERITQRGAAHVAAVFELSDGQTVTIYLHNPDVTPKKIAPSDVPISWRWLLNKKDITIVVAPENGADLNVREVAQRVMRLAEKNSPAFRRANAKRAERMGRIEALKEEISGLEKTLASAQHALEAAKVDAESVRIVSMGREFSENKMTHADADAENDFTASTKPFDAYLEDAGGDAFEAAKAFFKSELQGITVDTVIGKVHMLGSTWREMKRGAKSDAMKAALIARVPEILSSGKYDGRTELKKDRTDGFVAFHFFYKELDVDGKLVTAGVNVGERANGEYVYVAYGVGHDGMPNWAKNKAASSVSLDAAFRGEVFRGPGVPSEPTTEPGSTSYPLLTVDSIVGDEADGVNIFILRVVDKATGNRLTELEDDVGQEGHERSDKAGSTTTSEPVAPDVPDLTYLRSSDGLFTTFLPNTPDGEKAWRTMNATQGSEGGKILAHHTEAIIQQIRDAGYTVAAGASGQITSEEADALLAELESRTQPDEQSLIDAYFNSWAEAATKINAAVSEVDWAGMTDATSANAEMQKLNAAVKGDRSGASSLPSLSQTCSIWMFRALTNSPVSSRIARMASSDPKSTTASPVQRRVMMGLSFCGRIKHEHPAHGHAKESRRSD